MAIPNKKRVETAIANSTAPITIAFQQRALIAMVNKIVKDIIIVILIT
jgi:hypothetical protein